MLVRKGMAIYLEADDALEHMFNACTTDQIQEFIPEKRGFRIHGHSTTLRLERAFWNVLEWMAENRQVPLPELIEIIHDQCMIANDKNLASCLRVICLKYINIYTE
jgi:predicted DNA-binding ribbon-helix-helix protein